MHSTVRVLAGAFLSIALTLGGCTADDAANQVGEGLQNVDCAAPVALSAVTLRGDRDGVSCAYKGIPYAKAPLGSLRFQPPQPLEGHQGTLTVNAFANDCVQSPTFKDVPVGEDCLYLNVWIPGRTADGLRRGDVPVMVFFYGGGFTAGGGSWSFYNGESLTTHGVIVVTVNYRLGPLGYLAPSAVTDVGGAPLDGNLGLRDQTAALRWVQKNIAGLGGDPNRVTIFGESAGAWSVCDLMASTETAGLIHRAIMQSGECHVGSRAEIAAKADAWIAKAGCPVTGPTALACLRALDAEEIPDIGYSMGGGNYPNVDGKLLPAQPLLRLRAGAAAKIPLIAGFNREETDALRHLPDHVQRVTGTLADFWTQAANALTPAQLGRARDLYAAGGYGDAMALSTAMMDDIIFGCPAYEAVAAQTAQGTPAWHYRFSVGDDENALEPYLGSFHGLEIPYVFGNTGGLVFVYNDNDAWMRMHAFTERIQRYWTRFAATGDPNGGDDPEWPAFGAEHHRLELTVESAVTRGESDAQCAFWDEVAPIGLGERFDFIKRLVGFNPIE